METIATILIILTALLFIAAIVGLINPELVKKSNRLNAFFAYFFYACISGILFVFAVPEELDPESTNYTLHIIGALLGLFLLNTDFRAALTVTEV